MWVLVSSMRFILPKGIIYPLVPRGAIGTGCRLTNRLMKQEDDWVRLRVRGRWQDSVRCRAAVTFMTTRLPRDFTKTGPQAASSNTTPQHSSPASSGRAGSRAQPRSFIPRKSGWLVLAACPLRSGEGSVRGYCEHTLGSAHSPGLLGGFKFRDGTNSAFLLLGLACNPE